MRWGPSPVTSRVQVLTQSYLRVDLYRGGSTTHASGNTKLSYIAWEPSAGTLQGITFEAQRAQDIARGQWHALAFLGAFDAPRFYSPRSREVAPAIP
jgi:hypothetical protein